MAWRVDVPGVQRAYDTREDADAKATKLRAHGAKDVVVWWHADETGHESDKNAPESPDGLFGRVLGHLGFSTGTSEGIA